MTGRSPDAVIIGGGVIGCVIAWELAQRGLRVTLLERGTPGREATWAAGGMLSPLGETAHSEVFLRLALASFDRWPVFAQRLRAATGTDVEFRPAGKLHVALDAHEVDMLHDMHARGAGFGVDLLSGDEARTLEPALATTITAALLVGRDHRVNTRVLAETAWRAAEIAGATVRRDLAAVAIEMRSIHEHRHVAGVTVADGTSLRTPAVVVAAGAWSGALGGLPRPLPVEPVRGQMLAVLPAAPLFEHVIEGPGCYLVPRDSGRLLVGATSERAGFDPGPTPRAMAALWHAAVRVAPAIADLPMIESWYGFRPATPDELPILGADPDVRGLLYATGHYRNGVLLAPITGEIIAGLITAGTSPLPIDAFRVERFGGA